MHDEGTLKRKTSLCRETVNAPCLTRLGSYVPCPHKRQNTTPVNVITPKKRFCCLLKNEFVKTMARLRTNAQYAWADAHPGRTETRRMGPVSVSSFSFTGPFPRLLGALAALLLLPACALASMKDIDADTFEEKLGEAKHGMVVMFTVPYGAILSAWDQMVEQTSQQANYHAKMTKAGNPQG